MPTLPTIIYCWPEGFIPWLMNLQLFAHKLIKWLPGECADWFFDNVMTWSYCLHRQYSTSQQKTAFWLMRMHWTVKPPLYSRFHFCSMEHAWKHELQKTSHFYLLGVGEVRKLLPLFTDLLSTCKCCLSI